MNSASNSSSRRGKTAWDLPALLRPLPVRNSPRRYTPQLLEHYPAIVEFVYNERFVTADQVRRRFPDFMRSPRTAQYQLASLVKLGHVATAPVRNTSPNFPFVYAATGRGIRLVRDTYAKLGVSWQGGPPELRRLRGTTAAAILHEILTTEFDLELRLAVESRADLKLLATERRYFQPDKELAFDFQGRRHRVVPDSGFLLVDAGQRMMWHAVEMDNGTMSGRRLREKFSTYARWGQSAEAERFLLGLYRKYGAKQPRATFRLLIVASDSYGGDDENRLAEIFVEALELPTTMRDRIWLVTATDLRDDPDRDLLLAAALWRRIRDAKTWLPEHRDPGGKVSKGTEGYWFPRHWKQRFVAERVANLPRHYLFPQPTVSVRSQVGPG